MIFVNACRLLCQIAITHEEIECAHQGIVEFCKKFQDLCGNEACTPNMHMACHLKSCLLDFGPLAAFWAFSFERYNGTLEGLQKSWIVPEKQMFQKFLGLQSVSVGDLNETTCKNSLVKNNDDGNRSYPFFV